jgi:hypothetical protein
MGNDNLGYGPNKDDVELDATAAAASGLALEAGGNLAAAAADLAQMTDQSFTAAKLADQLALTTSADTSVQLSAGRYRICADASCYFLQADSDAGTDLATYADGHFLPIGGVEYITVTGATDDYLAALVTAGTGVLTISGPF